MMREIIMSFLLGRDIKTRKEWNKLFNNIVNSVFSGKIKFLGENKSRTFKLNEFVSGTSWPEPLRVFITKVEEKLKLYFGGDYYGSDICGGHPGSTTISFINPERRGEFEQIAPKLAEEAQKEILAQAKNRNWGELKFMPPTIYNYLIAKEGMRAELEIESNGYDIDSNGSGPGKNILVKKPSKVLKSGP